MFKKSACVLLAVFLLCGCAPEAAFSSVPAAASAPAPSPSELPRSEALTLLMDGDQHWNMRNTDSGYYDIAIRPDGSQLLYYTDFEQLTQTPLCSSAGCDHRSPDCTARTTASALFVYQEHLYQFQIPVDSPPFLERADLNGTDRQALLCLSLGEEFVPGGVAAAGNALFFATAETGPGESSLNPTSKINRLDLDSGAVEVIQSREQVNQFIVGVVDDKLVIKRFQIDPATKAILMPEFLLMDQDGGEQPVELPAFVTARTWIFPEGARLLLVDDTEGAILELDLRTGQTRTVLSHPFLTEHPGATLIVAASGDDLILNVGADYYLCTGDEIKESAHCYYSGARPCNRILARVGEDYLVCRDIDSCPKALAFISVPDYWQDADSDVPIINE